MIFFTLAVYLKYQMTISSISDSIAMAGHFVKSFSFLFLYGEGINLFIDTVTLRNRVRS